jgi:uracil-DNA glycosylase
MSDPSLFEDPQQAQQRAPVDVNIEPSWKEALDGEFRKPYFEALTDFVKQAYRQRTVYPPAKLIFNAFWQTPLPEVKVVILGQDPYHGPGQAHGLCFSVPAGIKVPPSLQNIYQELYDELGQPVPAHGNLLRWAQRGVFLLNAILTVRAGEPGSHRKAGWETFTNAVIQTLSQEREGLVFLLWGRFARDKQALIDTQKHYVLEAPHPSPYSARYGFFGCGHFQRANAILEQQGRSPIDWYPGDEPPPQA